MATVPTAISTIVRMRAVRRPFLSPIQPIAMAPKGRARNPIPKAAKLSSKAATLLPGAKKLAATIVAK
jgi:hypothetical protein